MAIMMDGGPESYYDKYSNVVGYFAENTTPNGYHKTIINKGVLGEFSKITEEIDELNDANNQNCKVLIICELCDLIGAIEAYSENKFNLTLNDLIKMKDLTKSAFINGKRK
jgi:phosphoribosyl-ATP pyrophosphohydrolase